MHYGSAEIGRVFHGSTEIGEGWVWDAGAWKRVFSAVGPIIATRADKTVTQNLPQSAWTAITWDTWTGDPVASGAVTISGAGQGQVTAELSHDGGVTASAVWTFRIVVNGVAKAEAAATILTVKTLIQVTVALNPGDLVAIQANAPSSAANSRRAAGGWLTITASP